MILSVCNGMRVHLDPKRKGEKDRNHYQAQKFFVSQKPGKGTNLAVDSPKLPHPLYIVQERSEVKTVIIRAVALCMIRWCNCGHLVSVHGVHSEEMLHFASHLGRAKCEH